MASNGAPRLNTFVVPIDASAEHGAHPPARLGARQVHVVQRRQCRHRVRADAPVDARRDVPHDRQRFVEHHPVLHTVAVAAGDLLGEGGEVVDDAAPGPAPLALEGQRQVPVVHRDPRLDAARQAAVDHPVVVGPAGVVPRPASVAVDPGPVDREPVGVDPEAGDEVQVLVAAVEGVDGVEAHQPVAHPAVATRLVPHRRALAVDVPRPLDLEGGRRHAPGEVLAEVRSSQRHGPDRIAHPRRVMPPTGPAS
ncbi:MAG: hypothetical protein R2690_11425 [Acidimicrobiales bacterium]